MAEQKTTLESLARLVSRAAGSAEKKFVALAEDIAEIRKDMVTKDDLGATESRLNGRIDTLDATVTRLDTKLTKFEESELDKRKQLEVRVSAIEKHLGIDKKIAA
jgi:hypothetical protein